MLARNRYAVIRSDKYLDAVVNCCPKLSRVIVEYDEISSDALNLLFQLPIESFECFSIITTKISAPYLKKIRVISIEPFVDCKLLETISIHKSSIYNLSRLFPNIKELEVLSLTDTFNNQLTSACIRDNRLHLLHGLNLKKITIYESAHAPPDWNILKQFKLTQLITWYFDNSLIENMPLNRLSITETSRDTPDIILKHDTLKHLSLTRRSIIELDTPNLYYLTLDECDYRTRIPDSVRILHINTAMICPYINCNLHTLNITTFVTPSLLESLPKTLKNLMVTPMEHAYFEDFPNLPNLCRLHIFPNFTLTEKTLMDITQMPITDLCLNTESITDHNIRHLAIMPLNYLSIQTANITIEGVKKIKHLPLRYLVLPTIPTHHFLQL